MGRFGVELAYRIVIGEEVNSPDTEPASGAPLFWSPMAMIGKDGNLIG